MNKTQGLSKAYIANNTIMYKTYGMWRRGQWSLPWTGTYNAPRLVLAELWLYLFLTLLLAHFSPTTLEMGICFLKTLNLGALHLFLSRCLDSAGSTMCLARFFSLQDSTQHHLLRKALHDLVLKWFLSSSFSVRELLYFFIVLKTIW